MQIKAKIIVLKTIKYSETSLIVQAFSSTHGKVSFLVKGARSSKAKLKANLLQPLSVLEVNYVHHKNKNLHPLYEGRLLVIYETIQVDMVKTGLCLYLLEILNRSLSSNEENRGLFEFVMTFLDYLDHHDSYANLHLFFLLELTKYFGFYPVNNYSPEESCFDLELGVFVAHANPGIPEGYGRLFSECLLATIDTIHEVQTNRADRANLLEYLEQFYQLHLPNFGTIQSLKVMKIVFE